MNDARAALTRIVEQRLAIRLGPSRPHDALDRWVRERAIAIGDGTADRYVARLAAEPLDGPEFTELVRRVTNGQTYFFRDVDQLEAALARVAMRGLAATRRAWVAACSTGEEAYTLAMLAMERGIDLQVLATDVNDERLSIAEAGIYDERNVQRIPARLRHRFVEPYGRLHRVAPSLRSRVRFERRNLLDASVPRPDSGSWDLVSCRNVFIYFGSEQLKRIVLSFATVLDDEGVLVLGSSETLRGVDVPFELAMHDGRTLYRKARLRLSSIPPRSVVAKTPSPPPEASPSSDRPDPSGRKRLDPEAIAWLDRGHAKLRAHEFDDAEACYLAARRIDDLDPEPAFFLGLLACKRADPAVAVDHLRRVLFLDSRCWPARLLLVGAFERAGDLARARNELLVLESSLAREVGPWPFVSDCAAIPSAGLAIDEARAVVALRARSFARSG